LTGQVADSVLYSGERISIGGETSVRGYRENLFLADQALIGSLELALPFSLSSDDRARRFDWGAFTLSAFVDGAVFSNVDVAEPFETKLASTGVSLAWTPSDAIVARVTYGRDLVHVPLSGSRDLQDRGFTFRFVIHPLRLFR
jgi:hemolysin activation/secretion protein